MTFRLVPLPGGVYDELEFGGLYVEVDLDYLLCGDTYRFDEQAGFSLRADVLVVAEEPDAH